MNNIISFVFVMMMGYVLLSTSLLVPCFLCMLLLSMVAQVITILKGSKSSKH